MCGYPNNFHRGDGALCHHLRGNHTMFVGDINKAIELFEIVDGCSTHDEELAEEILEKIRALGTDKTQGVLYGTSTHAANAFFELQRAFASVQGRFKGSLRDQTEERLRRAMTSAEALSTDLQKLAYEYQTPRRAHEIRRNELSCLMVTAREFVGGILQRVYDRCAEDASEDLITRLAVCIADWGRFIKHLERLREQSSRKLSADIVDCKQRVNKIFKELGDIELEAARRAKSWYPDYTHRMVKAEG